jgi:EAL domain-containing protein (putative c-di-GMP-specific phosphodiesterase class I)
MNTKKGEEMIKTILTLARRFDMDVVAEGIETVEHLDKLSQWGCEWGQGYLFSPAVDRDSATQLLLDRDHVFAEFFSSSSESCS